MMWLILKKKLTTEAKVGMTVTKNIKTKSGNDGELIVGASLK